MERRGEKIGPHNRRCRRSRQDLDGRGVREERIWVLYTHRPLEEEQIHGGYASGLPIRSHGFRRASAGHDGEETDPLRRPCNIGQYPGNPMCQTGDAQHSVRMPSGLHRGVFQDVPGDDIGKDPDVSGGDGPRNAADGFRGIPVGSPGLALCISQQEKIVVH